MLDARIIEKYDPMGMHKIYDMWPQLARKSFESEPSTKEFKNIDHIVFVGMGGSGALGDIFTSILSKTGMHVSIVKGYVLPNTVDANTLVVTTSITGNTVETLSALKSAKKNNVKIIAFSSGGKIGHYCTRNNIEFRNISMIHSPRASFIWYLFSMLHVLQHVINLKKSDVNESVKTLEVIQKKIFSGNLNSTNPSLRLARWITGMPMIYYPWGLQAAAIRFKNSLQENAKLHAMAEDILEASHNGIVSWEKKSMVQPILIQGKDDHIKTKERWKIFKEYFKQNNIDYYDVMSVSGSILSKLTGLIYMLDYSTIYLSIINKTDPTPTRSIDYIKNKSKCL